MEINRVNGKDGNGGADISKVTDFLDNHKIKFKKYKNIRKLPVYFK